MKSRGAPDVAAAPSAQSSESPDHPGNARGAGRGKGRCHSTSPAPSRGPSRRRRESAGLRGAGTRGLASASYPRLRAGTDTRDSSRRSRTRVRSDRFSEIPDDGLSPPVRGPESQGLCPLCTRVGEWHVGFAGGCSSCLPGLNSARFWGFLPELSLRGPGPRLITGLLSGNFSPVNFTASSAASAGGSTETPIIEPRGGKGLEPRPRPPVLKAASSHSTRKRNL